MRGQRKFIYTAVLTMALISLKQQCDAYNSWREDKGRIGEKEKEKDYHHALPTSGLRTSKQDS